MNLREAEELLPWWVAGTLPEEEARLVQAFVDNGDIPQEKITELKILEEGVMRVADNEPVYNPKILQNVMSQLDHVPQAKADTLESGSKYSVAKNETGFLEKIIEYLQWSLTPAWAKATIAAQFAVLAVVLVFANMGDESVIGNEFGTAAGNQTISADFTVGFNPQTTEAQIRALLQQYDATIVGGPNSLGMYTIDLPDNSDMASIRSTLEANAITTFVQPVSQP